MQVAPDTRSIAVGSHSGLMPKDFPMQFKLRAVELLAELENASAAAAQIMREYPGTYVASQTIAKWGAGLKIKLQGGRRKGAPPTRFSPNKDAIIACHARGLSQAQTVIELGLSRAVVSKHWPRSPA